MKNRGNFSSILTILPAAIIILFAFAIILPVVPESTHAEGDDPNEGITITISPEINANLISSENGDYKIVKDTVTIGTDALNGYTLYISTDTPNHQTLYLNGDTSNEYRINGTTGTYESPKTLGDYEWGFAVPGVGHFDNSYDVENPNENSKFAILPTENKIISDYTAATSEDATEVYYGFKLGGTIEPGAYETTFIYTAIPATQPLTAKAIFTINGNLDFVYDRNVYTAWSTYTYNVTGETPIQSTIKNIFNVPIRSNVEQPGWEDYSIRSNILSVNFEPSFYNFKPTSLSSWFSGTSYLASLTNPNNLNTSSVTDMGTMFLDAGFYATTFDIGDLSSWDTSNVTNMRSMFSSAGRRVANFEIKGIGSWDTSKVTHMDRMFNSAGYSSHTWNIGDIGGWDTSSVVSMNHMFYNAGYNADTWNIGNLDNWKTGSVTDMSWMFASAGSNAATTWNIGDIGGWDTGNVTNINAMFNNAGRNADTWNIGNLDDWKTGSVTDMSHAFSYAGYNAATWNIGDIHAWNVSNVTERTGFVNWSQANIDTSKLPWQSD